MNKDVIYIEPEDDITDILAKLGKAQQKVVALVPPKKPGVLRSAVNIKLIAKSARAAEKVAVLVTSDPTLVKFAASAKVPVAKTLQSRPEIPTVAAVAAAAAVGEQVIEDDFSDDAGDADKSQSAPGKSAKSAHKADKNLDSKKLDDEAAAAKNKADKKSAKQGENDKNKKVPNINKYRKFIVIGVILGIAFIGFLIWAIFFSASVKIAVHVKTTATNFSESVNFTTVDSKADAENGTFLLEQQKYESKASTQFTATGEKDMGNKASGSLTVSSYFRGAGSVTIKSGATFTNNSLTYVATGGASLSWDGESSCENTLADIASHGCLKSTTVAITASSPGEKYNINAQSSGWSSGVSGLDSVKNPNAISGGSTNIVKVVQQSDIDSATANLASESESEAKENLKKELGDDALVIESSYASSAGAVTSTPAVGEEVGSGVTPTLTSTTVYTVYAVDKTQVEDFIKAKSSLGSDQKIYDYGSPYLERFLESDKTTYTAKLKTTTKVGPEITSDTILEKAKGKKIGEVQSQINSINGVASVDIERSFFWVGTVPDDPNKITIEIGVDE